PPRGRAHTPHPGCPENAHAMSRNRVYRCAPPHADRGTIIMRRGIHTLLGAGLLGAGLLTAPTSAGAAPAEPCQPGTSNTDIRSCETAGAQAMPVPTLGDGICAGLVRAERITAFDGPLWEYSEAPGMTHGIEVNLAQGYAPLGEWGSTVLACDQTVH